MSARRAAHVDANHAQIVTALRRIATVQSLAGVGNGCPDLLVGFRGVNVVLEVKNPSADRGTPCALTTMERSWHETWAGVVHVVTSPEEAVRVVVQAARPEESKQ